MMYHVASRLLLMSLMSFSAIEATTLKIDCPEHVQINDVFSALVVLDNTTKIFGNSYKQPDFLHSSNSDPLAALQKLPELVAELKKVISGQSIPSKVDNTKDYIAEKTLKKALDLLAEQLTIKNLVSDYDKNKDWKVLRKGLEAVLDQNSPAYKQLQAISWSEEYAPWQIPYDGHTELVYLLVFAGNGINITDGSKDNMLHGAVAGGKLELVKMLLDNGAWIESRNGWGNAPLALACKYKRINVARFLWLRGAEVDGIDYNERWAGLHRGVENGDLEIVKFMVEEAGASTTIKDRDGNTPLELARSKGQTAVADYLAKFPH